MNIVALILSYFVEPFGIRPLVIVSAIMFAPAYGPQRYLVQRSDPVAFWGNAD